MESETGHPICSLCRRELSNLSFEAGCEAKLCEDCRGLVQTALHGPAARANAASAGAQQNEVAAYAQGCASPAGSGEAESTAFFDGLPSFSDTSPLAKQTEIFNMNDASFEMHFEEETFATVESEENPFAVPVAPSMEHEAEHEALLHEDKFAGAASSVDDTHFEHPSSTADESIEFSFASTIVASAEHDHAFVEAAPASERASEPTSEPTSQPSSEKAQAELGADLSELHHSLSDSLSDGHYSSEQPLNTSLAEQGANVSTENEPETVSADPWGEPLPAWDYSRNEYPVLMAAPRTRSFAKYKIPFAVFLILAFAAGFYYLIYPQLSRDPATPPVAVASQSAPDNRAATPKPEEAVAQGQTPAAPAEVPVSPVSTEAKPTQQPVVPSETRNAQGRFALQAAAFPSQAGADEFAEKLKAAGVASYVVTADLAKKGRWFRVRVGRFNTADEAQRFAAEAQLRAKAAGMSLQLMVSQYDQP